MSNTMLKAKPSREYRVEAPRTPRAGRSPRTPEELATYLDNCLREAPDDVAGIARTLGEFARARGMAHVAREAGLSRESLYRSLSDTGNPSLATVLKVARALGMRLYVGPA
jgi:probable addiction module antidote protein